MPELGRLSPTRLPPRPKRRGITRNLMNTFLKSDEFNDWLSSLKDRIIKARITQRIRSAVTKNLG